MEERGPRSYRSLIVQPLSFNSAVVVVWSSPEASSYVVT